MSTESTLAIYSDALVALGTASLVIPVVRLAGISPVIGYLAAGVILGPLGLGSFVDSVPLLRWVTITNAENVGGIAELGVVFLLFLIGLELSYERLVSMRRLVVGLGGLQILLSSAAISGILLGLGYSPPVALLLGGCLCLSSTAIILEVLSSQGRLSTNVGRASFAILLAQDIAVIPLLIFISLLAADVEGSLLLSIVTALAQAALAISVIVVGGRLLMRPLFQLVGSLRSNELFIAATFFTIIGTSVIAAVAGMSMALGAFVAGLLLAETEYRKAIQATVEPFKGLLLGMFFFTVGMSINPLDVLDHPLALISAVLALIAIKSVIIIGLARYFRLSWPSSIETGLLLGPGGEFAFVGIGLALSLGLLDRQLASFVLASTSLSMLLVPILSLVTRRTIKALNKPKALDPALAILPSATEAHALIVGYGRVGKVVATLLKRNGVIYSAIDQDAIAVSRDRQAGHDVFFGDATNRAFLEACGIEAAKGVIITIDAPNMTDEIVASIRALRPDIPIISRARDANHARHLYAEGVTHVVPETIEASLQLSEAALVGLGVATGKAIAAVHEIRDEFRNELRAAAKAASSPPAPDAPT